jgi:hypothetical protein
MPVADIFLVILCLIFSIKRRNVDTIKLSICMTIFIAYSSWFMQSGNMATLHDLGLGWAWYVIYAAWISIITLFVNNSKVISLLGIGYCYCVACAVATRAGSDFFYDSYPFVIFIMNVSALWLSNDNNRSGHTINSSISDTVKLQAH